MARAFCNGCRRTFGGVSAFDLHQRDSNEPPYVRCLDPSGVGLVERDGVWRRPPPDRRKQATPAAREGASDA